MSLPLRNTVPVARAVNSVDLLFVRAVDINLEHERVSCSTTSVLVFEKAPIAGRS